MNIPDAPASHKPKVYSSTPNDPALPLHNARVSPALRAVGPNRLRFRVRCWWADPTTPSGAREELIPFGDPRKAAALLVRIAKSPDRPLLRCSVEAIARPRWEEVPVQWLVARAEQREQREQREAEKRGVR